MEKFTTYNVKFPVDAVASVVSILDTATQSIDRDLLLAALMVFMLWLSDPTITKDPERLKIAVDSMSKHLIFLISMDTKVDPEKAN